MMALIITIILYTTTSSIPTNNRKEPRGCIYLLFFGALTNRNAISHLL